MKVRSFIAYPSYDREKTADWMAYNVTMALKGGQFKGYSDVSISGKTQRITAQNTLPIVTWFGQKVVQAVGQQDPGTAIFVLPSSGCTTFGEDPKAERLANAIRSARSPIPVEMPFRWIEIMPKAAGGGGTRHPNVLRSKMRFLPPEGITRAFLVDDVKTTGGHLLAASRLMRAHGVETVAAICFARTVWERPDKLITQVDEDLED
ncbi:hypothetical protein [Paracoccus sp. SY]|uniref:hypothetical protein n=1 Tax=Paracoccus sp. SY TaxID=1330255 RepID=UPI000CD295D3|nr:hypothetical protein [Paracoccus sp. SY]